MSKSLYPYKRVMRRDVRLGNLWKSWGRKGIVSLVIVRENWRRLVIERNCLETTERDFKEGLSQNLMITEKGELSVLRNNTDTIIPNKGFLWNWISSSSISSTLHAYGSSGCVGCYKRPALVTTVEGPSTKGLTKQGKAVEKPSTSEDFWTTSTHDMDNSIVQSQGSISSTSLNNQAVAPHGSSSNNPSEFVNHGLILWNQTRQRWVGNKKPESRTQQLREPKLSWNATYESLLTSNKPFRQPIPLAEMVDFLVDIWEQDGLYD
ncbi:hypothetical protein QL285_066535 [Trifolium repens]|nr:hypothetical protein QL285_066535 [Trifolium repens]